MRRLLQAMVLLCTGILVAPPPTTVSAQASGATSVRSDGLADRLASGENHTCSILDNGGVTCWGSGFDGQLGYGNTTSIGDDETPATNPVNGGIVALPGGRPAVAITAGDAHTCALLDNGRVTCWGAGTFGRLGYGNTDSIGGSDGTTPATNPVNGGIVAMPGNRAVVAISAGARHTCVILDNATVACWGDGGDGRLGYGNISNIGDDPGETPANNGVNGGIVALPGGLGATAVAAGGAHTCALLTSGDVTCWGNGGSGRLGYGNLNNIGHELGNTPATNPATGGIVQLPDGHPAVAIAAGAAHTCVILQVGIVSCWGAASLGQNGLGFNEIIGDDETPAADSIVVVFGAPRSISAGSLHTCVTMGDFGVSCWGFNEFGQLGYGNTNTIGDNENPINNPVNVGVVPLPGNSTALAIAVGTNHSCAMLDNGVLTCWGAGGSGQLGMGNNNDIGDNETPAANPVAGGAVPLPGSALRSLDAGALHNCALLGNGSVTCWGGSPNGRLGYGLIANIGDNEFPSANATRGGLVDLPQGRTATAVSNGDSHTCALLDSGEVTCWGAGGDGRLGYGNTNQIGDDERPADNPVNGAIVPLPGNRKAVDISAGGAHTCAVLDDGTVTCWGDGGGGQLGYGNQNDIGDGETPETNPVNGGIVPLPAGRKAVAVSAGFSVTCALLDNGSVSCWGDGLFGGLGYGNTNIIGNTPGNTPATNLVNGGVVPLPAGRKAIAVETSGTHTCALLDNSTLTCWGTNTSGQLGRGNEISIGDDESLATFGALSLPHPTVVDFSVGYEHTCAVFSTGSVSCWGEGTNGRLGGGSTGDIGDDEFVTTTVSLPAGHTAVRVAAGSAHTCVALDNGAASCWGLGTAGRLGYSNVTTIGDDPGDTPATNPVNGGLVRMPSHMSVVQYRALQPARLADTRPSGTTVDGLMVAYGPTAANSGNIIPVAGRGGVPIDATSVTLSVAAVAPSAAGFIKVYPCAAGEPNASSINYAAGTNTANTVITGIAGGVCIQTSQTTHYIIDVVGYTPRSSSYVSLTPTRYADTRASGATFDDQFEAAGQRAANSTYTIDVGGRGELPIGAETVALNVVAVGPAGNGFLTVFPCGQPVPNASNLNFRTGVTAANMVITNLPDNGELCVFTSQPTQLIVDVVGHFSDVQPTFTTLRTFTPGRLVDTRASGATTDGRYTNLGALVPNATNTYQIANRFPLAEADVAVLNITAVNPPGGGFVTVWPCDQTKPNASSLNYTTGVTRAVQVVSALSATGTVCVSSSQAVNLIIDAAGSSM
jgi:alpha-tubulin suppressor-like RCC1 family protein